MCRHSWNTLLRSWGASVGLKEWDEMTLTWEANVLTGATAKMNGLNRWRSGWWPLMTVIHHTCGRLIVSHGHQQWLERKDCILQSQYHVVSLRTTHTDVLFSLPSLSLAVSGDAQWYFTAEKTSIKGVIYGIDISNSQQQGGVVYQNTPIATKRTNKWIVYPNRVYHTLN